MIGRFGASLRRFSGWRGHYGMAGLVLHDRRREVAEERRIVELHDEYRSKTAAKGDSKPDRR